MTKAIFVSGNKINFIPASHEDPADPGVLKRVLFAAAQCPKGQLQMVNWARMEPGKHFQKHYHQDMTEVFIILKGLSSMIADSDVFEMCAGDGILIPPDCRHQMNNCGSETLEYLVFGISEGNGGKTINVL